MVEWIKTNIIAALTLSFVLISAFASSMQYHTSIENKLEEINKVVEERKKNITKQNEINERLINVENKSESLTKSIEDQKDIIKKIVEQNSIMKTQSILNNNTITALNTTLDKVNITLDKLNNTVNTINYDIVEIKSDIKHMKGNKDE